MDIPHHARVMGHLPIVFYPGRPTRTLIAMAISAMVELFFSSSILLNSLIGMDLIPTHVGGVVFWRIIVHHIPPMVRTYLKNTKNVTLCPTLACTTPLLLC